jgi:hypothetical protein
LKKECIFWSFDFDFGLALGELVCEAGWEALDLDDRVEGLLLGRGGLMGLDGEVEWLGFRFEFARANAASMLPFGVFGVVDGASSSSDERTTVTFRFLGMAGSQRFLGGLS